MLGACRLKLFSSLFFFSGSELPGHARSSFTTPASVNSLPPLNHIKPAAFCARTHSGPNSRMLPCGHGLRRGKRAKRISTPLSFQIFWSVTSYVGSGTDLLPVLREATPKVATYVLVFILTVIVTDPRTVAIMTRSKVTGTTAQGSVARPQSTCYW